MTRKEAKNWLNNLYVRADITDEYGDMEDMHPYEEAVKMAIKALEREATIINKIPKGYNYDCETRDFIVYRNIYTGDEIHIEKPIPLYRLEQESNDVLDKIKSEILCNIVEDDTSGNTPARLRADWDAANKAHMIDIAIIERHKTESEE